ncbi:hypothetical protein GCM10022215_11520 [Nocardioides fonticola]|uniref:Acyl-CoA carboxylase subunit epsilon n=1 Tax=Nocardioides fonticola TaxID=450363 RepID=A0ABP7XFW2_9ACTN
MAENSAPTTPLLRVVNPDATPEEIAAIVAVLSSLGTAAEAPRPPRSAWASPARAVRGTHTAGAGAWRASGLPR